MATQQFCYILAIGGLFACCGFGSGYQDNGNRLPRPWPPLRPFDGGDTLGFIAPCDIQLLGVSGEAVEAISIYQDVLAALDPDCVANENTSTIKRILINGFPDTVVGVPSLSTDESFTLQIDLSRQEGVLRVQSYAGVLRGLETFVQLVGINVDTNPISFYIEDCPFTITEVPSFQHRGLLLDPSRTFITIDTLKQTVDALLASKMNVLHLHLSDSQSIPLLFPSVPELSQAAAYSASEVYSPQDIDELVLYARLRGVRVIPEIDTPGHARAWGLFKPELTTCSNVPGPDYPAYCAEPPCGQLNPAANVTYETVRTVLKDVQTLFVDSSIHLGYDEINLRCWEDDSKTQAYMDANQLTAEGLLQEFYERQRAITTDLANDINRTYTFWEDVVSHGLPLQESDTIQVWSDKSILGSILSQPDVSVIISWAELYYLDCGRGNLFGNQSWCDPFKTALSIFEGNLLAGFESDADKDRVLGGEACLWGELVGPNLAEIAWPRTAALGGRLWNHESTINSSEALLALDIHAQRLRSRGVPAASVTLRFCVLQPELCFGAEEQSPNHQPIASDKSQTLDFVLGLSLLAGILIVALVVIVILVRRLSAHGSYLPMDPSTKRLNHEKESGRFLHRHRVASPGGVVWYGGIRPDDSEDAFSKSHAPSKLLG